MKILITGICGFVGSTLAGGLQLAGFEVFGLDNFIRAGSETNRFKLAKAGIKVFHADLRAPEDLLSIPRADWVIDAAANPSVLAGMDGLSSSKQVFDHNLIGTINLLEYCKRHVTGFLLLSTSRVYSIPPLASLPVVQKGDAFVLDSNAILPAGVDREGVTEQFSTESPVSLYGASKIASEVISLEYGSSFNFPVWINRCGVLAGAGQFGRADQGIFSFWINAYLRKKPLKYIGFGGRGLQVRDALHPLDLIPLIQKQLSLGSNHPRRIYNVGGGVSNAMSLLQLSIWCRERFGETQVNSDIAPRPFDIPWMVMNASLVTMELGWKPQRNMGIILEEIADHARSHADWLEISTP